MTDISFFVHRVKSRGASQLAAEAAVNRNIELEEDSKMREYNEQDIEA